MNIHEYQAKELLQKFNVATALPRESLRSRKYIDHRFDISSDYGSKGLRFESSRACFFKGFHCPYIALEIGPSHLVGAGMMPRASGRRTDVLASLRDSAAVRTSTRAISRWLSDFTGNPR
jgi:hypothetical protein